MTEIYRTTVTAVGPQATEFTAQGLFVTFGDDAPAALREFCYIVAQARTSAPIVPGQRLVIDGTEYPITAVGDVAQRNLDALGHVTVNVDGSPTPKLAGAIHIAGESPVIGVGTTIAIEGP
ncbi:PTS glucitol/sorbitol transporter subunit IIA [Propionicicella superfundia]|uniref:PTS glucitol/sorbitol transporter subunit IIA n=1 Tax=Propionicicella superfundia TaxID=348582 RepID=UPI00040A4A35|nr:PTS glucitol/sorbitol transporter subunit IIA [Propionicicella superfundia]